MDLTDAQAKQMYEEKLTNRLGELEASMMTAQTRLDNLTRAVKAQNIDTLIGALDKDVQDADWELKKAGADLVIPYGIVSLGEFFSTLARKGLSGEKLTPADFGDAAEGLLELHVDVAADMGRTGLLYTAHPFLDIGADLMRLYGSYQWLTSIKQARQQTVEGRARIQQEILKLQTTIDKLSPQIKMVQTELGNLISWK